MIHIIFCSSKFKNPIQLDFKKCQNLFKRTLRDEGNREVGYKVLDFLYWKKKNSCRKSTLRASFIVKVTARNLDYLDRITVRFDIVLASTTCFQKRTLNVYKIKSLDIIKVSTMNIARILVTVQCSPYT